MNKLSIVMYHYTRDLTHSRYPEIKGLDLPLFKKQLDFFKHNFTVVTMEDVIESQKTGKKLPDNALLLTFDDGYSDNYTFALPLLEEYGFQGSFFIPGKTFTEHKLLDVNKIHLILASSNINEIVNLLKKKMDYYRGTEFVFPSTEELFKTYAIANRFDSAETIFVKRILQTVLPEKLRNIISSEMVSELIGLSEETLAYELYMTENQIAALKRHGMHIGLHGYDHYWLGNLPEKQMKEDTLKALDVLSPYIDKNAWVMNYPYGSHNENTIEFIKSKGAVLGLATEVNVADLDSNNPFAIPRLDCNDFPPKSTNYINYK